MSGVLFSYITHEVVKQKTFDSYCIYCVFGINKYWLLANQITFSLFCFHSDQEKNIIRLLCFLDGKYNNNKTLYSVF